MTDQRYFVMYWTNDDGEVDLNVPPTSFRNEVMADSTAASIRIRSLQASTLGETRQFCIMAEYKMMGYVQAGAHDLGHVSSNDPPIGFGRHAAE